MNSFQVVVWLRFGAGAIPRRFRAFATVSSVTSWPRLAGTDPIVPLHSRAVRVFPNDTETSVLERSNRLPNKEQHVVRHQTSPGWRLHRKKFGVGKYPICGRIFIPISYSFFMWLFPRRASSLAVFGIEVSNRLCSVSSSSILLSIMVVCDQ